MRHDRSEAWRKSPNLGSLVGKQRGGRYQKTRLTPRFRFVLENQQQRQDLDRLAETHVIRKAGPRA